MRKTLHAYKAVFFDAGDTLVTISEAQAVLMEYLAERNIAAAEEDVLKFLREALDRFYVQKERDLEAQTSPEAERRFWVELYRFVLIRLGLERHLTSDEIHAWCHELYDVFLDPARYVLFDDVKPTLQRLADEGFRIGLISNFASALRGILKDKGILHFFDPLIISAEVGIEKPNPAIFRMALDQAGLQADEVLYVGDHETNDIWAPGQVGIDAVRIKRYPYQEGKGITALTELFESAD
jgi:putative hydrolase of the HAD superfamily